MSRRYKGGVISATAPVPTGPYQSGTAPGIWTLPRQMQSAAAGTWPTAGNILFNTIAVMTGGTNGSLSNGPYDWNSVTNSQIPTPGFIGSNNIIAYNGTRFVACPYFGVPKYTTNGVTWTTGTITGGGTATGVGVAWNGSLFVMGLYGTADNLISSDGITWTRNSTLSYSSAATTHKGTQFLIVSSDGYSAFSIRFSTSTDGSSWSTATSSLSNMYVTSAISNGSTYVVLTAGAGGSRSFTSTDGVNWSSVSMPVNNSWSGLAWGNGVFVATPQGNYNQSAASSTAAYSTDGVTWNTTSIGYSGFWSSVVWNGTNFLTGDSGSGFVAASSDGITWSLVVGLSLQGTVLLCSKTLA